MAAENQFVEASVLPHIGKYLLTKLGSDTWRNTPHGLRIGFQLAQLMMPRIVEAQPVERKNKASAWLRIQAVLSDSPTLDPRSQRQFNMYVEDLYYDEFHTTVDRLVYSAPYLEKRAAITFFREQYGITEDDLPLLSSERNYQRYEDHQRDKKARKGGRGGSRSRSGPEPKSKRYIRMRDRRRQARGAAAERRRERKRQERKNDSPELPFFDAPE